MNDTEKHVDMLLELEAICRNEGSNEQADAMLAGAHALRAQQERENPKPLTLEELKERVGKPVWIKFLESGKGSWEILGSVYTAKIISCDPYAGAVYRSVESYGKTWLAYDHEPKEAQK
jgi:hypothetical protein